MVCPSLPSFVHSVSQSVEYQNPSQEGSPASSLLRKCEKTRYSHVWFWSWSCTELDIAFVHPKRREPMKGSAPKDGFAASILKKQGKGLEVRQGKHARLILHKPQLRSSSVQMCNYLILWPRDLGTLRVIQMRQNFTATSRSGFCPLTVVEHETRHAQVVPSPANRRPWEVVGQRHSRFHPLDIQQLDILEL